jgi:predicted negative regulator of RcsB-dependent stress response
VDDLLSEKEQIDQIRSWWSEYGAYVIGGVLVTIAGIIGFNHMQSTKLEGELAASAAYETLVLHVANGKLEDAESVAGEIAASHADTAYAPQAGLAMARLYMDKNRDQDAADALLAVVSGDVDNELRHIARLRLGRIYLYQGKSQEVVDLLESEGNASFAAAYGEVLGDAYAALGQVAKAQAAYLAVLGDPLVQGTVDQQLVQWKSLDLPEIAVDEAARDDAVEDAPDAIEDEAGEGAE